MIIYYITSDLICIDEARQRHVAPRCGDTAKQIYLRLAIVLSPSVSFNVNLNCL